MNTGEIIAMILVVFAILAGVAIGGGCFAPDGCFATHHKYHRYY